MHSLAMPALCLPIALCAQTPPAPRFEVASIKPSAAGPNSTSGIQTGRGKLYGQNVTLKRCIIGAYSVSPHQVVGGPDWLDSDRFEINAKSDQPAADDPLFMTMLQALLADRFKLALHRETRPMQVYVLEATKAGAKLDKAPSSESGTNTTSTNTGVTIDAHNIDMDSFAQKLARSVDLPVVNRTGLDGIFNLKLSWTPERARSTDGTAAGPSIFSALQEQLGLRLRSDKTPVEVLVIDHAERPTEN